ncbi:MAG: hypothetical protein ACRCTA_00300, partial [Bacilli bacterium]
MNLIECLSYLSLNLNNDECTNYSDISLFSDLEYLCIGLKKVEIDLSFIVDLENLNLRGLFTNLPETFQGSRLYFSDSKGDFSNIKYYTNLEELTIFLTPLSDLNILENLDNIEDLSLSSCKISNITPIGILKNLEILYINDNNITDISSLSFLTNLY